MTASGWFISFEGGDGSGKSTQSRLLGRWLAEATGREVVLTREPGGTDLGRELRTMVLHGSDVSPRVEALLYATDRAHHVATVVRPALDRGAIVLTDRYLDSSVAYQAGGRLLPADEVEGLSRWAVDGLMPHVTVLLDLEPDVAMTRIEGALDRLESSGADFHRRTREAYLTLAAAEPGRWVVVDAQGTPEQVHDAVRRAVAGRLELDAGVRAGSDADAAGRA
ncbi:MAG: dTMP kinase [Cellulomonadaceae bacterium]